MAKFNPNLWQTILGVGSTLLTGNPLFGMLPGLFIDRKRIYKQAGKEEASNWMGNSAAGFWNDITGKTNTQIQNSAAMELQHDQQAFNERMANTAVQRSAADFQAAGFNPALAVTNGSSAAQADSGIANAQASNVSVLQSVANSAITAGMLIKIFKTLAK